MLYLSRSSVLLNFYLPSFGFLIPYKQIFTVLIEDFLFSFFPQNHYINVLAHQEKFLPLLHNLLKKDSLTFWLSGIPYIIYNYVIRDKRTSNKVENQSRHFPFLLKRNKNDVLSCSFLSLILRNTFLISVRKRYLFLLNSNNSSLFPCIQYHFGTERFSILGSS